MAIHCTSGLNHAELFLTFRVYWRKNFHRVQKSYFSAIITDDLEFKMFPPHCIAGTAEAEVIPELSNYQGEIIPKKRYSGFYGTNLEEKLLKIQPDKLIICGVLTNICVMHTTADARNRDYEVEIPVNCVASPDEAAHRFALEHMDKVLGAKLIQEVSHA